MIITDPLQSTATRTGSWAHLCDHRQTDHGGRRRSFSSNDWWAVHVPDHLPSRNVWTTGPFSPKA